MKRLYLMVTIVTRHLGEKYLNFYLEHELEVQLVTLGRGTVIHAKGTGTNEMGKFFGMSLAAEKEMTMIVTRKEQKNDIMRAIMERAGMESKAKTFLFSLPVSGVAGVSE